MVRYIANRHFFLRFLGGRGGGGGGRCGFYKERKNVSVCESKPAGIRYDEYIFVQIYMHRG